MDLGREMKHCPCCKSGRTQTITKGRKDEGKKSYSKSGKWHMESHGELGMGKFGIRRRDAGPVIGIITECKKTRFVAIGTSTKISAFFSLSIIIC